MRRVRRGGNSEDYQLMFLGDVESGGDGSAFVDGDTLVWNEEDEKFLPTTIPVGSGAANSLAYWSSSRTLTALANGVGVLTNDGSGGLTWGSAGSGTVTGTGTTGRVAQWSNGAGGVLADSTLVKSGAGVVTLSAAADYAVTVAGVASLSGTNTGDQDLSFLALKGTTITVSGLGLSGGGDLSANRTITLTSSSAPGVAASVLASDASGDLTLQHLKLAATSNQLVLQSAGVTGTLTWTPTTTGKVITLPDLTGTAALGAGSSTASSSNSVTVSDHTHAIDATIARSAITIGVSGTGLSGGGDLSANRTIALASSSNPGAAASILATDSSGNLTLKGLFTVNANAAALSAMTGAVIQMGGADSAASRFSLDGFAVGPQIIFRRANNTAASPSALASGNQIGAFQAFGYGATAYTTTSRGYMAMWASQDWTDANQGTYLTFATTPNNSTAATLAVTIGQDQSLTVAGAFGCNTKSAQTAYASGGAAPAGGTGATAGAYDTAAHRDALITLVNNIRTALVNNGIMS